MSMVRRFVTPNRLTRFVNTPDGIPLAEAIARAEANVAEIKPPSLDYIDELLAEIGPKAPANPSLAEMDRLYTIANELAGIGGLFDLAGLGRAAYSLCELVDSFRSVGTWNAAAVTVHFEGLRLLRQEETGALPPEAIRSILAGLDRVVTRFNEGAGG
jgi:hypothetical protein